MKFDLDKAWREAMALLKANLGLLASIAGVFYFLPNAAAISFIPDLSEIANSAAGMTPEAMLAAIEALFAKYWWLFLALIVIGGIGSLAMLALMRQNDKPTVAEALGIGLRLIATYLATQIIMGMAIVLATVLFVGVLGMVGGRPLALLGNIFAMVAGIFVVVRLTMVSPVIAVEGETNPLTAMRRSWALTRGSGTRLLLFYILLAIAFLVISSVITMFAALAFAFASAGIASFGMGVVDSATNAIAIVVGACILAATHSQLGRVQGRSRVTVDQ